MSVKAAVFDTFQDSRRDEETERDRNNQVQGSRGLDTDVRISVVLTTAGMRTYCPSCKCINFVYPQTELRRRCFNWDWNHGAN